MFYDFLYEKNIFCLYGIRLGLIAKRVNWGPISESAGVRKVGGSRLDVC